jgi:hypothetical protein
MRPVAFIAGLALACAAAAAQEREWTFDTGEQDAYLIFGVPETDDTGVSFWCPIGSGEIRIFVTEAAAKLEPDTALRIEITVAKERFAYDGKAQVNQESGIASAEATIDAKDKLFDLLQTADRFSIKAAGQEDVYPLTGADFPSLLRTCRKP